MCNDLRPVVAEVKEIEHFEHILEEDDLKPIEDLPLWILVDQVKV